jgi:hypothetical protein
MDREIPMRCIGLNLYRDSDESFDCLPCIVGSNTVHAVEQSRQLTVFREKFNGYIPRYRGTFGRSEVL